MVEFWILGPLEVVEGSRPLMLGGPKQRALLAVLLLHRGEVVSADHLIDELWGERPPATAVKTLQGYVSRLRKSLGEGVLHTRGSGYVITLARDQLDLDRFDQLTGEGRDALAGGKPGLAADRLREALALWRGPPLDDFTYAPFAQSEIARLEEARLAAIEDRIEAELASGRHVEQVAELELLVREHPLRERMRGQLMLALYRSGRQADALECYSAGRRVLLEELGIEPGRALQDLQTRILRHDADLEAPLAAVARSQSSGATIPPHAVSGEPVVGRDEQLEQLRHGLDAACGQTAVVFMIGGEAGIGKTRLADELARNAQDRGARVVWGRCWEAGGAPAYWPWVQVLRALVRDSGRVDVPAIRGAGANSLVALVPELGDSSDQPTRRPSDSDSARFQLFDAVASLLRDSAAAQPLVIVLDDLHAADTPSLLLLQFVVGQLGDAAVLIAGLYRDDERDEEDILSGCLAALARERVTRRMRLTGLSEADTTALIESITGKRVADAVNQRIHAETEGNPLFVGEIVRLLETEGELERTINGHGRGLRLPDTVREVIGQRLRRLAPEVRRLLSDAAILGREFGVRVLAAVAESDEHAVLDALDEGIAARVITNAPSPDRLRFSHALVRETLYEALGPAHRRAAHLRAGEILERFYAADPEPHLAEIAHHFSEALPNVDPWRAVDYAQRAADRAVALLAYEEAARLYALALEALEPQADEAAKKRCALLVALGDARARAGDEPASKQAFLEAAGIAERSRLPVLQAQAALGYGGRFVWSRAYDDTHVIPLLERALRSVPSDHAAVRVKLMARLSGALRDHPARERRASLSAQAVEIARALDDPATLAYALDGHYSAMMWPETAAQRVAVAEEIIALAEQVADDERATAGRLYRVIANMELGRMRAAEAELEIIAAEAAALRQPAQLWITTSTRANLALFHGRFGEAQALIGEALKLGERAQSRDSVLSHRLQLFVLHREVGGSTEIDELIHDAASQFQTRPVFRCALAYIYAHLGDTDSAQVIVDDLAAHDFAAVQRDNEYLFSLSFLSDTVDALCDLPAAAILYDLMVPFAHLNAINGDEIGTGSVARSLGVLAAAMRRWDAASRHFEMAVTHNNGMGADPWVAHSQHDYGRMLLARNGPGDRARARELLGTARETYERLGMNPWLTRVKQLLGD